MTYSRKLGTASPNANPPMLKTPKVGEVDLGLIMPMISKINGGIESYRWGQNNKVEKEAIELHQESFKKYGILGSFVVVKVPKSFTIGYKRKYESHKKGDNIKSIILEYSLIMHSKNVIQKYLIREK